MRYLIIQLMEFMNSRSEFERSTSFVQQAYHLKRFALHTMSPFEIREGQKDDHESLARVLWKAFEVTHNYEEFMKEKWIERWNNRTDGEYAYVAVEDGRVRANLAFRDHEKDVIRGRPIRFAAVWAVATEPNYRRQGMVRELFKNAFLRMKEEGFCLSILDPFYVPFYEKFGYALAECFTAHEFTRDIIRLRDRTHEIRARELLDIKEWDKVDSVQKTLSRFGSRIFNPRIVIQDLIRDNHLYLLERESEPVGVVKFAFDRDEKGISLFVQLITSYVSAEVFPSIVELISNQASNMKKISWWCDEAYPVRHFVRDPREITTKVCGSMMMRVIDFEKYCLDSGVPEGCEESIVVGIEDELCPWNTDTFELISENGSLVAERVNKRPEINLTSLTLSKVISGLTPARMLLDFGELDCSKTAARKLEALFPADSFMSYWRF